MCIQYIDKFDSFDGKANESASCSFVLLTAECKLKLHGARISKILDNSVTHIIADKNRMHRAEMIKVKEFCYQRSMLLHFLNLVATERIEARR